MCHSNQGSPRWLVLVVALSTAGCGTANTPSPPIDEQPASDPIRRSVNEIGRDEILGRGVTDSTVMRLIQHLRPSWLQPRGTNSVNFDYTSFPLVYVDGMLWGELQTLSGIFNNDVLRVEYFEAWAAATRWGTGHRAGVINIVTRRP